MDDSSSSDDGLLSYQPFRKKTCTAHGHSFWSASRLGLASDSEEDNTDNNNTDDNKSYEDDKKNSTVVDPGVFDPKNPYLCFDASLLPNLDVARDNQKMQDYADWVIGEEAHFNTNEYKEKQLSILKEDEEAKKQVLLAKRISPVVNNRRIELPAKTKKEMFEIFQKKENKKATKMVRKRKKNGNIKTISTHFK